VVEGFLSFLFLWNVTPQFTDQSVVIPFAEQNRDDGQLAVLIGMYEVHGHVKALPVNFFLAGLVKVKLFQRISFSRNRQEASGRIVNHDRVTVIDDM
jgi:hypothetical protein